MTHKADTGKYDLFAQGLTPRARTADPETSHLAVQRAKLTSQKVAIALLESMYVFHTADGTSDQDIHSRSGLIRYPDSSVRGYRCNLVKMGFVEWSGKYGKTKSGNRCRLWKLTNTGMQWVKSQPMIEGGGPMNHTLTPTHAQLELERNDDE